MTSEEAYWEAKKWHEAYGFAPPELEAVISTGIHRSYWYAYYVLKSRFELGESVIIGSRYEKVYRNFLKEIGIEL